MLDEYQRGSKGTKFRGDNGEIIYDRCDLEQEFERAVYKSDIDRTEPTLNEHPELATGDTYFWSEGILVFPAKENDRPMIDLLMSYGAKVPRQNGRRRSRGRGNMAIERSKGF